MNTATFLQTPHSVRQIFPAIFAGKYNTKPIHYSKFETLKLALPSYKCRYNGDTEGCIPPTRPKEVLTWHLYHWKSLPKIFFYCTLLAQDAKIELMLTITQKPFFVSLDELALFMEPDMK